MGGSQDTGFIASPPSTLSIALQTTVLCPTFVANLLGNICVCLASARVRSLRERPSTSILASLAVSDLSLLSFLLFRLIWLYDLEAASKVCECFLVLLGTLSYVSIVHICLLSCDRYIAIVYPLRYKDIITTRRVKRVLAVVWGCPLVSFLVLPLMYSKSGRASFRTSLIGCSESDSEPSLIHKVHLAFNVTFFVLIPFAVMVFVYGHIAKISWSQNNRVEPGENLNPETAELRRKKRKEMKWMKTIVMVIGAFALCYLPAFICVVLTAKLGPSRVPIALRSTLVLMIVINSALNPMIYMFRSNEFKRAFRKLFRGQLGAQIENNTVTRTGASLTRVELSTCRPIGDHLPSFSTVPENATSPQQRLKVPVTGNAGIGNAFSVEVSQGMKTMSFSHVMVFDGQGDPLPSLLNVPIEDTTSPDLSKIGTLFDSEDSIDKRIGASCLEPSTWGQKGRSSSFLGVPYENEASSEPRFEVSLTAGAGNTSSMQVSQEMNTTPFSHTKLTCEQDNRPLSFLRVPNDDATFLDPSWDVSLTEDERSLTSTVVSPKVNTTPLSQVTLDVLSESD